jgi:hypothetical protein
MLTDRVCGQVERIELRRRPRQLMEGPKQKAITGSRLEDPEQEGRKRKGARAEELPPQA